MNDKTMEEFEVWADEKGFCLDHIFMSTAGVPENPYTDSDTNLAYEIWCASRSPGCYGAWKPIESAPRDGRRIECWHVVHSCPVAVMYNESGFPWKGEMLHWQEATHTHSWPERAFSHWREIPQPPTAP